MFFYVGGAHLFEELRQKRAGARRQEREQIFEFRIRCFLYPSLSLDTEGYPYPQL